MVPEAGDELFAGHVGAAELVDDLAQVGELANLIGSHGRLRMRGDNEGRPRRSGLICYVTSEKNHYQK